MKIWIINQYALAPDGVGGTRHYSFAKRLIERGNKVFIVASDVNYITKSSSRLQKSESAKLEVLQNVPFLWLKGPEYQSNLGRIRSMISFAFSTLFKSTKYLDEKPDCVIGSTPNLFAALGAYFLARRLKAIFILEIRDLWPQSFIDLKILSPYHPLVLLFKYIESFLYRRSDGIVTLLEHSIEYICDRGATRNKITWIPNGVDLKLIPANFKGTKNKLLTFMYAGSHGIPNDLEFVLDVINEVNNQGFSKRCSFRFIGDGPKKSYLIAKKNALNLENVFFEPAVAKEEIYTLLDEADVFLLSMPNSPLYTWGFSLNKLYDYMAMRRPILFFNEASYDPVDSANAGISVKTRDIKSASNSIVTLLNMPIQTRQKIGLNGRCFIETNHNTEKLSEKLETKIKKLLSTSVKREYNGRKP